MDDRSYTMEQLVRQLAGKGVTITNVTFDCPTGSSNLPYGYFNDEIGVIGLQEGLILTTGAANFAVGPNDNSCKSQENSSNEVTDPDLLPLLTTEKALYDVCKVEFDLVVNSDSLIFKYVFGSEEYLEYPDYHDVFGFFISGPGISGTQNLAVISNPQTGIPSPVNVNTINPNNNSKFYVNNGTGATPFYNMDLQYDGYTVPLFAKAKVIPCETYRLKLIIADVKDQKCDAGVFIERGSFTTPEPVISKVVYQHPQYQTAMEGCNKAYIVFKRGNNDKSQAKNIKYFIKGTAENGIDYHTITDNITIPAGKDTAFITIDAIIDNIADAGETVKIVLPNICPGKPDIDSIEVVINELFPYKIPSEKFCPGEEVVLNKNFKQNDSIRWNSSPYLSCLICPAPVANPPGDTWFYYEVIDKNTGCRAIDSVHVKVLELPIADFEFSTSDHYLPHDIFFTNLSVNSDAYFWTFGDGNHSTEKDPLNSYPENISFSPVFYNVTLISKVQGHTCTDTITKTIEVGPFFIPNLLTKNEDQKNDEFRIVGIKPGFWNVSIYNRWGQEIFKSKGYNNKWKGEDVADGIYFFHFSNGPKDREFKGWLHIIK